jgi:hypothetical protein
MNRSIAWTCFASFRSHERKRVARGLRAPGAANSVHVILRVLRHIVIDYVRHIRNIQPARGNVRGHQHLVLSVPESSQRLLAFPLAPIRVNHRHRMLILLQQIRDLVRAVLASGKTQ